MLVTTPFQLLIERNTNINISHKWRDLPLRGMTSKHLAKTALLVCHGNKPPVDTGTWRDLLLQQLSIVARAARTGGTLTLINAQQPEGIPHCLLKPLNKLFWQMSYSKQFSLPLETAHLSALLTFVSHSTDVLRTRSEKLLLCSFPNTMQLPNPSFRNTEVVRKKL